MVGLSLVIGEVKTIIYHGNRRPQLVAIDPLQPNLNPSQPRIIIVPQETMMVEK
jgi:hypothetical protein